MSIGAVIGRVQRNDDGTATISLEPRRGRDGSLSCAGQSRMTVENPPPNFEACVGTADRLAVGETRWADRVGYTRLRLLPRK